MKKVTKIGISIGSVAVMIIVVATTVNLWVKSLVCHQLDQNIASADSLVISYDDIRLAVFRGKAWIKDVNFRSDTLTWEQATSNIAEAHIDVLSLDGINYFNWILRRQLNLRGLTIVNPQFRMRFINKPKHKQEGDELQQQLQQERQQRLENVLSIARIFIDDATLDRLTIDHAKVRAEAINDSLKVVVPEFSMRIYDVGYSIKDTLPHYNDSVFHFLIKDVDVNIPKVNMKLSVAALKAEPNGMMEIDKVRIHTFINPQLTESVETGVDQITIGGFNVAKFNSVKQMDVKNIHFYHPYAQLRIDESNQGAKPKKKKDTNPQTEIDIINQKMADAKLDAITEFITGLTVDTILLHDAAMDVQSISTAFNFQAKDISTALYGVGWSLIDQIPYHYNDSIYQFYMANVDVITPDSFIAITAQNICYNNGGAFSIGKTHIHHIVNKWQLAHLMGDVPVSLIDMWVDSLRTSSKNIVKEAFSLEGGFYLDTLFADVKSMHVFRDARYQVKEPYKLPQAYICQLSYPFVVHCVKAKIGDMHIEMALSKKDIGKFDLGPLAFTVSNVTPIPNSVIRVNGGGKMGTADITAKFNMTVNQACNWDIHLTAKNLDTHHLDEMIYPIVGMKIGCDVHRIKADYSGDTATASGTFCMEYDNVDIFADKNSNPPITIVKNMSGLINSAGKTLVNKSNPKKPGQEPVAYQVKWKNDPWVNPALFYVGPVIDGCIETMLPGLFLHRRVKDGQSAVQSSAKSNL